MRRATAILGLLLAGSCSEPELPAPPPVVHPAAPAHPPAEPTDFTVSSTITFASAPSAPHRLRVTFQGDDLCRWTLARLNDEDSDRLIEYRYHGHAFKMPQDRTTSVEYSPEEAAVVFARFLLRRLVLTDDPASSESWTTKPLADGLGTVQRRLNEDGSTSYTYVDPDGVEGESLTVLSRFESEGRSWPKKLRLNIGSEVIWTETVDSLQTQSWFEERSFVPPDRSTELSPE